MYKKTIKFTDYNGAEREEDFYFNLSKAELMEMELSVNGGLTEMVHKIVKAQDSASIVKVFKELILKSYGEKSLDGRRFVKSQEISDSFEQTEAYSMLFMELSTDEKAALEFINGIVPSDLSEEMNNRQTIAPKN